MAMPSHYFIFGGPGRIRTYDQSVMLTTIIFITSLEFVVWTVSLPQRGICHTVSTPSRHIPGLARDCLAEAGGSPNLTEFNQRITPLVTLELWAYLWHHLVMNNRSNCVVCDKRLSGKQSRFCSVSCKNRLHQSYPSQKRRGLKRKIDLVREFGGECSRCGYNKNIAALEFHHKKGKSFKLDARSLSNRTQHSVSQEAKKCELVCSNCHAEIHNPDLASSSLSRLL